MKLSLLIMQQICFARLFFRLFEVISTEDNWTTAVTLTHEELLALERIGSRGGVRGCNCNYGSKSCQDLRLFQVSVRWQLCKNRSSAKDNPISPLARRAAVLATSEVIPSRAMRALEGEGRGLSHLEVTARERLWRQLASRGIDRGAQRVNAYLFALIVSLYSSRDHRPRCRQSWTLILTPIQVFTALTLLLFVLLPQPLPPLTPMIPNMNEAH
jgi:hypothetical protein